MRQNHGLFDNEVTCDFIAEFYCNERNRAQKYPSNVEKLLFMDVRSCRKVSLGSTKPDAFYINETRMKLAIVIGRLEKW